MKISRRSNQKLVKVYVGKMPSWGMFVFFTVGVVRQGRAWVLEGGP